MACFTSITYAYCCATAISYGMDTKEFGFLAENIAARYLEEGGYEIIAKNYRKPWGEIDVIARKDGVIIFVEVKANSREFSGGFKPEVRVNNQKLRKITKTANLYMGHELCDMNLEWRIDIISITFDLQNKKAKISHFKNI